MRETVLLSTLQTLANCRSSPAQHMPGTCSLHWLGIRTHGEERGGEGQQKTVIKKKKIKSDRQTETEQAVELGVSGMKAVAPRGCMSAEGQETKGLISPCSHQLPLQCDAPAGANAHGGHWRKRPGDKKTSLFRDYSTLSNPREDLQAKWWLSVRNR